MFVHKQVREPGLSGEGDSRTDHVNFEARTNEELATHGTANACAVISHTLACLARSKSSFMVSSLTRFFDQSTCYKVACIDDDKANSRVNTISQ
jgi:hypothetical protein